MIVMSEGITLIEYGLLKWLFATQHLPHDIELFVEDRVGESFDKRFLEIRHLHKLEKL